MNAIEAARSFGGNAKDWKKLKHGAVVHKDATIGPLAKIKGPAIIRGGIIHGGWIYGGTILGGTVSGGTIHGGTICEGTIRGGVIHGGMIHEGDIYGGTIRGGCISGGTIHEGIIFAGTIHGGTICEGTIRGGVIRGGIIHGTPLQIGGMLPWFVNVSAPGRLQIGCEDHSIETWRSDLQGIADKHDVTQYLPTLRLVIEIAQKWFEDNPNVVVAS